MKEENKLEEIDLDVISGGVLYTERTDSDGNHIKVLSCTKTKIGGQPAIAVQLEGEKKPRYFRLSCGQYDMKIAQVNKLINDTGKDHYIAWRGL